MTITMYTYGAAAGLTDLSPFCAKLDAFLRIAGLEYESKPGNPRSSPKGKLPCIRHEGVNYADSSLIIDHLIEAFALDLDDHLDATQRAVGQAYKSMLEEHLYFILLYFRWQDPAAWSRYRLEIGAMMKEMKVPGFMLPLVLRIARKGVIKALDGQGIGRHSREEVAAMGGKLLDSISGYLGEQSYFFGEQVSSLDATVFAMVDAVLTPPIETPLKEHGKRLDNLVAYVARFRGEYYS